MKKWIFVCKRILLYISIFIIVITINFFLIRFIPGDPLEYLLGQEDYTYFYIHDQEQLNHLREEYGLHLPAGVQYINYIVENVKGNFGWSYHFEKPISVIILYRLKWTLVLLIPSIVSATIIGSGLGIVAGWNRGKPFDAVMLPTLLIFYSTPTYCLGLILMVFFAFKIPLFPLGGITRGSLSGFERIRDIGHHLFLPLITQTISTVSYNFIIIRNLVSEIKNQDFIVVALSKGLPKRVILFRHVFKNVSLPMITVMMLQFGFIVSGTLVVEVIFAWPGMGTLIYDSIIKKDYPMLQGCFLILSVCVMLANFLADILYTVVDPRVREGEGIAG